MGAMGLLLALGLPSAQPEPPSVWRVERLPAEHHPCLLFAAEQLPAMRERMGRPPYSGWWQSISRSDDMVSQALTWRLTGDAEKAKAVRERLLRCNPTGYHCCCGVADALQGVAEAYDLIYDYAGLSETDHRVIRAKIANACERLYLSALETGSGQHPGNQRTRGICALGTAAMVLADYQEAAHTPQEWLQRALDGIHEDRNLEFWRDDGMFIEGPTYSAFTLSVMLPFARYYRNVTGQWLFDDPRLKNALQYLVYVTQPDGACNAIGTTNMMNVVNSLKLCIGAGDPRDQAAFRWALDEWGNLTGGVREFCLFDESVKPSIPALPTTRVFPVTQEVSWRNEWSRHALALWFKGKDPWLAGTHPVYSHGDVGSFVLHACGELLAVDAGYDHWVSRDLYPANLHNTLLVDGEGPTSETTGVLENLIDAEFVRSADVVTEYAGIKLRRTFLLVEDQFVVIVDDIDSLDEHEYTWQIHTPVSRVTGEVTVEGTHAYWTGFDPRTDNPGRVTLDAYFAGGVDVAAVEGSRWQPYSADPKTGSYDNWTVVARQRGKSVKFLTVLYPHPTGIEGFRVTPLPGAGPLALELARDEEQFRVVLPPEGQPAHPYTGRVVVWGNGAGSPDWFWIAGPGGVQLGDGATGLGSRIDLSDRGVAAVRYWEGFFVGSETIHVAGPKGMALALRAAGTPHRDSLWWRAGDVREVRPTDPGAPWSFVLPEATLGPSFVTGMPNQDRARMETECPKVLSVRVDHDRFEGEELIDLGHVAAAPHQVEVVFGDDRGTPRLVHGRATLNGVRHALRPVTDDKRQATTVKVLQDMGRISEPIDYEMVLRVTDDALPPNYDQFNLRFSLAPLLANGGFEEAGGWGFGDWSRDEHTKYDIKPVADNPHSGKRCLMMRGIAGSLNMVASQTVPLKLGATYVLRGFYRGDAPAKASLCNTPGTGQYIWSPAIGPAPDWTPFEWEFTVENPDTPLIIALRLGSVGVAYFDDLDLAEKTAGG